MRVHIAIVQRRQRMKPLTVLEAEVLAQLTGEWSTAKEIHLCDISVQDLPFL